MDLCGKKNLAYRIVVGHDEDAEHLPLVGDGQVRSVVGVGEGGDGPRGFQGAPLVLQSVALDGVQVHLAVLGGAHTHTHTTEVCIRTMARLPPNPNATQQARLTAPPTAAVVPPGCSAPTRGS